MEEEEFEASELERSFLTYPNESVAHTPLPILKKAIPSETFEYFCFT